MKNLANLVDKISNSWDITGIVDSGFRKKHLEPDLNHRLGAGCHRLSVGGFMDPA